MRIVNATPHPIKVRTDWGEVEFEASGILPRVTSVEREVAPLTLDRMPTGFEIPCIFQVLEGVEGLPEPDLSTIYIVSRMVFEALPHRYDLIVPDTGETCIRDEKGRILAVTRFIRR